MPKYPLRWLLAGLIILSQISFSQTISNQANAQFNTSTGSGDRPSNTVTVVITPPTPPPVTPPETTELVKTALPAADTTVTPGQALEYRLTFTNPSDITLTDIVLTDPFDANYRLQRFAVFVDGEALASDSDTVLVKTMAVTAPLTLTATPSPSNLIAWRQTACSSCAFLVSCAVARHPAQCSRIAPASLGKPPQMMAAAPAKSSATPPTHLPHHRHRPLTRRRFVPSS